MRLYEIMDGINDYSRPHELFDCRSNTVLSHRWRAIRTKLLIFAMDFKLLLVSRIFRASNKRISCVHYSGHMKDKLIRKTIRRKEFCSCDKLSMHCGAKDFVKHSVQVVYDEPVSACMGTWESFLSIL